MVTMLEGKRLERLILVICCAGFFLVPMKILSHGFMPPDDGLRHVAKSFSSQKWTDVMITRPDAGYIESHPGWHWLLEITGSATNASRYGLVGFSVVVLWLVFFLPPLFVVKRAELFVLVSLLVALFDPVAMTRFVIGRPFTFTMSAMVIMMLMWDRIDPKAIWHKNLVLIAGCCAFACWMHSSWYLLTVPVGLSLFAGNVQKTLRLGGAVGVGVVIGALFTANPVHYLVYQVMVALYGLGSQTNEALVSEYQPIMGSKELLLLAGLYALYLIKKEGADRRILRHPAVATLLFGWLMGLSVARWWLDVGVAALFVFAVLALEQLLPKVNGYKLRLACAMLGCFAIFQSVGNDYRGRWQCMSCDHYNELMVRSDDLIEQEWLPAPGGVMYANDMRVFYNGFFAFPNAPWRYMLGFEAGLMPAADQQIWFNYMHSRDLRSLLPWVERMTPNDRFMVYERNQPGPFPQLEWIQLDCRCWLGRLKRHEGNDPMMDPQ